MPIPTYFFADLVRESSAATGPGAMALSGALPGHRRFADAVPPGVPFCYAIAGITAPAEWEVGVGHIDDQGRLERFAVSASSAAGALVPFTAGLKNVVLTVGANWYAAVGAPTAMSDIAGLQAALDGKQVAGTYAPTTHGHGKAEVGLGNVDNSSDLAKPISSATQAALDGKIGVGGVVTTSAGSAAAPALAPNGDGNTGFFFPSADTVALTTGGAERLRLSATGYVGIGTNAPNKMLEVRASDAALRISTSSNGVGPQVDVRASPTVGQVGTSSNHNLEFTVNSGPRFVIETSGAVRSGSDNAYAMGTASYRWNTIYLGTSPIVTSDQRDKIWHGAISGAEAAAAMDIISELGFYQWQDAVKQKGAGSARLHFGVRAQRVWAIMARHDLVEPIGRGGKPGKTPYAFLCFDQWKDPADRRRKAHRFGVRTDQLMLFLLAALAARVGGRP